jgi:glycosyltransferase involved in cell wall biosynthesis
MRVLMVTPYLPYPPSSGGQVRSYNLLKHLAKKHQITLLSLITNEEEKKYLPKFKDLCSKVMVFQRPEKPWMLKNILQTGFGFYPFVVVRNLSKEARSAVEKELASETYDLIHAETFYVMPHIPETKVPILLVEQTIEFQVYQHYADTSKFWPVKPLLYFDVFKIRYWETKFWQKASRVVAVSEDDKQKMKSLVAGLKVDVVPNGVGEDLTSLFNEKKTIPKKPVIFFQGNFHWLQNTEAAQILAQKIFPLIRKEIPQAVCRIAGQMAQKEIGHLRQEGIEIRDLASADIEGVKGAYREATVFLAPLEGPGGTRLKILGAMAAGMPVITTPTGIQGIKAENKKEVFIEEDYRKMAAAAIKLIKDQRLYQQVTEAARHLVRERYDWKKIAHGLDQIYQEVGKSEKS